MPSFAEHRNSALWPLAPSGVLDLGSADIGRVVAIGCWAIAKIHQRRQRPQTKATDDGNTAFCITFN